MSNALELFEARVSGIRWQAGLAVVHFSHACLYHGHGTPGRDPGSRWSQEAELLLWQATATYPLPALPDSVEDGFLEVGGMRLPLLPLPFKRRGAARLWLAMAHGGPLEIAGTRPLLALVGAPQYLADF